MTMGTCDQCGKYDDGELLDGRFLCVDHLAEAEAECWATGGVEDEETDDLDDDGDELTCWCGAVGTYEELFDDSGLDRTCGGSGVLQCTCGGDFCVCHHHGETECPGCEDCEGLDADEFDGQQWGYDDDA